MSESTFKFPTEQVELPSKGLIYPKDHPLSSGKIEMKYMTAREEDILTNQSYIKKLYHKNVFSVLDFSTEGFETEEEFDLCLEKKISIIDFVKGKKEIPFVVFKPSLKKEVFTKIIVNITGGMKVKTFVKT